MNCTGKNCPMQHSAVDPANCQAASDCIYATPPITNADCIRAMTDEELAIWINNITTNALSVLTLGSNKQTKTIFYWLDWLKKEAKSEEEE